MQPNDVLYGFTGMTKSKDPTTGFWNVKSVFTSDSIDLDGQICDPVWLAKEAPDWFNDRGNFRVMHQPIAVGKAKELTQDGSKYAVGGLIVDQDACVKLENDIYTGMSIGIKGAKVDRSAEALKRAPNGVIVGGKIVEVSLVDVPANPDARIESLTKRATITELVDDELILKTEVVAEGFPCADCNGFGETLQDGEMKDCPTCEGSGLGDGPAIRPSNDGGDQEEGSVKFADQFGWSDEDKAAWTPYQKSLMPDSVKKDYSDKDRKTMATNGQAMPGGGYPIKTVQDLKNAIQAIGRAKDRAATIAHIKARAKALGQEALIPDSWKSALADLVTKFASIDKAAASDDEWLHDPDVLNQVRQGLVACMTTELQELASGANEVWDISQLNDVLGSFLRWWSSESYEGETSSPYVSMNEGEIMSMFGLSADPDLVKAASAVDATDEQKDAVRVDILTKLGVNDLLAKAESANQELLTKVSGLEERLAKTEEMAAPRGISLRQQAQQRETATKAASLEATASEYRQLSVMEGLDAETKTEYRRKALEAEESVKTLRADN